MKVADAFSLLPYDNQTEPTRSNEKEQAAYTESTCNHQRPYWSNMKKHTLNQTGNNRTWTRKRAQQSTNSSNICYHRKHQQNLFWQNVHLLNLMIPCNIKPQQQIHLNPVWIWYKRHPHWSTMHISSGPTKNWLISNLRLLPKIHWLDKEASNELKQYNQNHNIQFQLVPPHMHRCNAAERAICTWKNHFVAGLCCTDTQFPTHLWDQLIAQATITSNLLHPS